MNGFRHLSNIALVNELEKLGVGSLIACGWVGARTHGGRAYVDLLERTDVGWRPVDLAESHAASLLSDWAVTRTYDDVVLISAKEVLE